MYVTYVSYFLCFIPGEKLLLIHGQIANLSIAGNRVQNFPFSHDSESWEIGNPSKLHFLPLASFIATLEMAALILHNHL